MVAHAQSHAAVYGQPSWLEPNIVYNKGKWLKVVDDGQGPQPLPPATDAHLRNSTTVLVMIAALRESRCASTLADLFAKADHPGRVHVALVQQNLPGDPDCVAEACTAAGRPLSSAPNGATTAWTNPNGCAIYERTRVLAMSARDAKGPLYARARGNELVRREDDFCMQIDAHCVFARGWDRRMLLEWGATRNEHAVLSTYPTSASAGPDADTNKHHEMPHLCGGMWMAPGVLHNDQARAAANLERPLMAPMWAAGLSFSRCHAERLVPNDPNLRHIFHGEEFARGARLWTHGCGQRLRPRRTPRHGPHAEP